MKDINTKSNLRVYILLVILFAVWSNSFIVISECLEKPTSKTVTENPVENNIEKPVKLTSIELTVLRFLPIGLFCLIYLLIFRQRESIEIVRIHWWKLIIAGILCVEGYNIFLYVGQLRVVPPTAALIVGTCPIFIFILSLLVLKEKFRINKLIGIILAFISLFFTIQFGSAHEIVVDDWFFVLLTMIAPLSWAVYTIITKPLVSKYNSTTLLYICLAFGMIPLIFLVTPELINKLDKLSLEIWLGIGYLSIFCTLLGFTIWNWALQKLPATNVSAFIYINPPLTIFFSWLFIDFEITPFYVLGAATLIFGIYLINKPTKTNFLESQFNVVPEKNNVSCHSWLDQESRENPKDFIV